MCFPLKIYKHKVQLVLLWPARIRGRKGCGTLLGFWGHQLCPLSVLFGDKIGKMIALGSLQAPDHA